MSRKMSLYIVINSGQWGDQGPGRDAIPLQRFLSFFYEFYRICG